MYAALTKKKLLTTTKLCAIVSIMRRILFELNKLLEVRIYQSLGEHPFEMIVVVKDTYYLKDVSVLGAIDHIKEKYGIQIVRQKHHIKKNADPKKLKIYSIRETVREYNGIKFNCPMYLETLVYITKVVTDVNEHPTVRRKLNIKSWLARITKTKKES